MTDSIQVPVSISVGGGNHFPDLETERKFLDLLAKEQAAFERDAARWRTAKKYLRLEYGSTGAYSFGWQLVMSINLETKDKPASIDAAIDDAMKGTGQ